MPIKKKKTALKKKSKRGRKQARVSKPKAKIRRGTQKRKTALKKQSKRGKKQAKVSKPKAKIRRGTQKRKTALKKQSKREKKQARVSKPRGQIRRGTKRLKRQIEKKEAPLLEKDRELASVSELTEKKAEGLESSPVQKEELIGGIIHYYSNLSVGIIDLTGEKLRAGDVIHIKGKHTDFTQTVDSLQIEHQNVSQADKGKIVGVKVKEKVREHDQVFRV